LRPRQEVTVEAFDPEANQARTFACICRADTPVEVEYYRNGGILQTVLRSFLR
jgi:aconitate hydratase